MTQVWPQGANRMGMHMPAVACLVGTWCLGLNAQACISDGPPQHRAHQHHTLPAKAGAPLKVSLRQFDLISFELPGQNISAWQVDGLDAPEAIARTLSAQELDAVLRSKRMITPSDRYGREAQADHPMLRDLHLGALRTGSTQLHITAPSGKLSYTLRLEVAPPFRMPDPEPKPPRPHAKPGELVPKC